MQERRAPPPTSTYPQSYESRLLRGLPRTTRLPATFSAYTPPTALPYLSSAPSHPAPRTSSLPASSFRRPSNSPSSTRQAHRNFSIASVPASALARLSLADGNGDEPRPKSFPPVKTRTRQSAAAEKANVDPAADPFQLHAHRVLRSSASSSVEAPAMALDRSSSSSSTSSSSSSTLKRQSAQKRPPNCLRRTATVRSAHRHSRTGSILRTGTRKRLLQAVESISSPPAGWEGLEVAMSREGSADSASVYSQESPVLGRRGGGVLVAAAAEEEGAEESPLVGGGGVEDLLRHWTAFVGGDEGGRADSPLMYQSPPLAVPSPPPFLPDRHQPSPASPLLPDRRPTSSARSSRAFPNALPRTSSFLSTRAQSSYFLPPSPSFADRAEALSNSMTRVDSELLLARTALKRLASTGFEGDALDRLGRETREEQEAEEEAEAAEEDVDDFADRYRDSYVGVGERAGWKRTTSSESFGSSSSSSSGGSPRRAWRWRPTTDAPRNGISPSTSTSSSSSASSNGGLSASSSLTSLGSLSRWSKSTLMDELEREFAELSEELRREQSATSSMSAVLDEREKGEDEEEEGGWEDDEGYVPLYLPRLVSPRSIPVVESTRSSRTRPAIPVRTGWR
ncbi:hypothetical protein JCM8097_001258 [Rhodosporidiobolus ruineniae]